MCISNKMPATHPMQDAVSLRRCFLPDKCSIWEDHRFMRACEPVNKMLEAQSRRMLHGVLFKVIW